MTTVPRRVVIDLELTGSDEENEDFIAGLLIDVSRAIDDPNDILDSHEVNAVDPREPVRIVVAGSVVDGLRFYGPVPGQLDGSEVNEDFDDEQIGWCFGDVEPYPNSDWVPLPWTPK